METERAPHHEVDPEWIRVRAYYLAQERPNATPEENWLLAEAELAAAEEERHAAETAATGDAANLRAKIGMAVYGHS